MSGIRKLMVTLIALSFFSSASAQEEQSPARRPATNVPITVAATSESVRFTALGSIERLRLEVFDAQGQPVFDTGFVAGNVRDWRLMDRDRAQL